jgi:hypothetical protein
VKLYLLGLFTPLIVAVGGYALWRIYLVVTYPIRWKWALVRWYENDKHPTPIDRRLRFMEKTGRHWRHLGHGWYFFWSDGWRWREGPHDA